MKLTQRSLTFDYAVAIASVWISSGILFDTWAHGHVPVETFFTPYHGLVYSGMVVIFGVFIAYWLRHRSFPPGYRVAALGIPLFLLAGVGDMFWHIFLGLEEGVDAIMSPTHQALGAGILLLSIGPVRSVLADRANSTTLRTQLPLVLSMAATLTIAHFGTAYALDPGAGRAGAPPIVDSGARSYLTALSIGYYKSSAGMLIAIFQAMLVSTFVLWMISRIRLAPGSFTIFFIVGNTAAAAAFTNDGPLLLTIVVQSLVAGIVADWLVAAHDPQPENPVWFRIFAFSVPFAYTSAYIVVTLLTGGTWWDWNIVLGTLLWCGASGFYLSLLGTARRTPS